MGLNKPLEKEEKVELAIQDDFDDIEDDLFEDDSDIYDEWCQLRTKITEAYTEVRLDLHGKWMSGFDKSTR